MISPEITDEIIFELLCQDDQKAFSEFVRRFWEPLFKSAAKVIDSSCICEEIVQNVFIGIWKNRSKISIKYSIKTYLFACVRYEIFKAVKKEQRKWNEDFPPVDSVENFNPLNKIEYKELLSELEEFIQSLPKKCSQVFYLSRIEGLSHKQIACTLNISEKTVENQIGIALKKLRAQMQKNNILFFIFF